MSETCKDLVRAAYNSRIGDIRKLWNLYREDCEARTNDGENWNEYGLAWDYLPPGTFTDQKRGYFRYQLSYGGPSEEFRFYVDERLQITRCEFWYLDWFDGAKINVTGKGLDLLREIWDDLVDCECPQAWLKKANEYPLFGR